MTATHWLPRTDACYIDLAAMATVCWVDMVAIDYAGSGNQYDRRKAGRCTDPVLVF